jgi:hypothetical protein
VWGESFTWTDKHPSQEDLKPLLFKYDELAANAYERIVQIFEDEQSATTEKKRVPNEKQLPEEPDTPKPPPAKLDAFDVLQRHWATDPALHALWAHINTVPEWVDWDQIARGQDIFYRYAVANLFGLAYQSLFVGLAAARPVQVLLRTGGFSTVASKRRGFETGQWDLQVTKDIDSLQPGGEGWTSTVRVRLLHCAVRSRIRKMADARPAYFNVEGWGIPINDFDQAVTICGFCTAPIWSSLPRQKIQLSDQEIIDYVALWRYIAYVIGAPEHYFCHPAVAKALQDCALLYEVEPNKISCVLAQNLLSAFQG